MKLKLSETKVFRLVTRWRHAAEMLLLTGDSLMSDVEQVCQLLFANLQEKAADLLK